MNFQRMRRIDKMAGIPLCFAFSLWRKTLGRFFEGDAFQLPKPRKILFIKLIEQGSTVLAYDTLKRASEAVGAENIYFWVFDENRVVLDFLEIVPPENVFEVRSKPLFRFAWDILNCLYRIRRAGIDTVVDLEQFARAPALLSYMTGAPRRVGLHRFTSELPYRGDLMTHRVQYNAYIHTSKMFRLVYESAYEDPRDTPLPKIPVPSDVVQLKKFRASSAETEILKSKLLRLSSNVFRGPIVLFNANCSDMIPIRKWASENYLVLAERLLAEYPDLTILFTGAPSEAAPIEEICRRVNSPRAISVAGKTTFRELVVMYTLADVLLTNDSGPGHFSAMTDICCVTLFGPETPVLYGTLGENKVSLSAGFACTPCVSAFNHRYTSCTNNKCMQAITTDQVYAELKRGLRLRALKATA